MEIPRNAFKRALREGRPQIGLWLSLCSHIAAEIGAGAGFDWLMIDTEHAPNELPNVHHQLQAAAPYPVSTIVRPAWNDMVIIKRLLDVGAQTLLIPFVQSGEEARRAVAATRYPPQGVRGVSLNTRANRYGRVKDYHHAVNDELCVLVQIETRAGLDNLDDILAVPDLDGVFVGPADLAADLGHLGDSAHPEVQAAIADALKRIRAAGKAPGILAFVEADARRYLDLGALFVCVGSDQGLLVKAADALAAGYRR